MSEDFSNGYDAIADEFISVRLTSGRDLVAAWAASLPRGGAVVDVGAGSGAPLTAALIDAGLTAFAIDASPKMAAAFRRRFPDVEVACEPAEHSRFFDRTFDAALAVGLVFLLPPDGQRTLLRRVAEALRPGGRLLFSAPRQVCAWRDSLTGRPSSSLGADEYACVLAEADVSVVDERADEGGTHYFDARKSAG
ncbi:MAG: class I SAM-dependent methyltransferase [Parvularculaceae bacterium]